jgi:hypothetical protein
MLASLLFPYDDDAKGLIDGWLAELQAEGCIVAYKVGGDSYIEICNWLIHQKIDKPSKSKIPPFDESSRILANPRECSSEDQRKGSKDQGEDQDHFAPAKAVASALANLFLFAFCPVTKPEPSQKANRLPANWSLPDDWSADAVAAGVPPGAVRLEADKFRDYWCAKSGKDATKLDWRATWRNWCRNAADRTYRAKGSKHDLSRMNYTAGSAADGKF